MKPKRLQPVRLTPLRSDLFSGLQADPRKEAIRRELLADVARIKLLGLSCVAGAVLVYLLTGSVLWYILSGLLGAAGLHILGFVWAREYFASADARREEVKAARRTRRWTARAELATGACPEPGGLAGSGRPGLTQPVSVQPDLTQPRRIRPLAES